MNGKRFSLERALQAADLFVDSNDRDMTMETAKPRDYGAFRAAFRGTDRGRVQSTICKLWQCEIMQERKELLPSWETDVQIDTDATDDVERHRLHGNRLCNPRSKTPAANVSPQTFTVVITGDRFLYKMIRNIVGTIVAVGCGHLELDDVRVALDTGKWGGVEDEMETHCTGETPGEIIESSPGHNAKIRTIRRICAPARGLTLAEVNYPDRIHFDWQAG